MDALEMASREQRPLYTPCLCAPLMQPPGHTELPALMTDWAASVNAIRFEILAVLPWAGQSRVPPELIRPPIAEAVARRHAIYERIHPFLDGNGRTGRLLTNLLLVRLGYPPAIIYKRERPRYLEALRKADQGDYGPLGELLARAVLDNLMRFILPAVAGPAKLVPLEALATKDLSVIALRNAAERGRLRAVRTPAGTWQSSKQWVTAYKSSRYKALRQPRPRRRPSGAGS
jgi:Fic/DOC family